MYRPETMERNLSHGNIAEAMLRLWAEKHEDIFQRTHIIQTGFNPLGIVKIAEKSWLSDDSDPDFSLVRKTSDGSAGKVLFGISVNAQQRLYDIKSTSGGYCSVKLLPGSDVAENAPCPLAFECFSSAGTRLWYNRPNIENDYPRFEAKSGAADTLLISFVSTRPARVAAGIKKRPDGERKEIENAIWDYLKNGIAGSKTPDRARAFARTLEYGNRRTVPLLKDFGLRWFFLSEITTGRVPFWITGGLSDNGRPPKKYCLPVEAAHDEAELVRFLSETDARG
jgi:hypothetical protein